MKPFKKYNRPIYPLFDPLFTFCTGKILFLWGCLLLFDPPSPSERTYFLNGPYKISI